MTEYIALINKDTGTDYGVIFPDFPGCVTAGATVAEAKRMARETLASHIKIMKADGIIIPFPSTYAEIMSNPLYRGTLAFEVALPLNIE
ncbi:type II toxin-antitoxin system HicB family antitoxin [Acetobacteraceae bacterium ESL0709]|nr:type II toxin-antitoxin system HicB family antitoxin [Acetobacteraceae bacterium ESL0697]MDF7678750.1 type II toxin-antitoxin system HicB family antitoxin [Acetobacteraceae bacterium ESL0709]